MTKFRRTIVVLATASTLAVGACNRTDDHASLVKSANDYLAKNEIPAAIIQLRNARQQAPNDAEVRFLLGKALLATGDFDGAESELRKALDLKYAPDAVYPLLASATILAGNHKKAISEFGQVELSDPKARAQLQTALAHAHMTVGDLKQARVSMEAALAADPKSVRAQLLRAQLALRTNDTASALGALDTALAAAPNETEALVLKAKLLDAQGKRDEALPLLEKAVEGNAFSLHARVELVSMLLTQGRVDQAEAVVAQMTKLSARDLRTVYAQGMLAYSKGDAARARDLAQAITAKQPENVEALYLAALANLRLKNWNASDELLRKVIGYAPNDPAPRRMLVASYLATGRVKDAREAADAALKRMPDDSVLLRLAGDARMKSRNVAEAKKLYERAAAIDRTGTASQLRLAQVRLATGDTSRALSDLEQLASKDQSSIEADLTLYGAHIRQREYDKALAVVNAIEKKQPRNALVHELRAAVHIAQRKYAEARRELARALEVDPKRLSAARSLALIDLQENKVADAKARYEKMIAAEPKSDRLLIALAEILALSGAPATDVKSTLERAIAVNPNAPGPRVALVSHYRRIGDLKGAVEAARAASSALPADPQITDLYGSLLLASGDHGAARDTFARLAQQLPQSPTPWVRIADANLAARDYTSALEALRKALSLQPEHGPALIGLAKTYMLAGKPDDAIAEAKKLQREKPKAAMGYALESELLAAQKKLPEAIAAMREALARQQHPALAARQLVLFHSADRASDAKAFADKWAKDHPKDVAFLVLVGQQRQERGDTAGATSAYRAALAVDPDNVIVLNNLAWILNEQGKPEARDLAERAYRVAPLQPSIVDTYGHVLFKQGDAARGLALIRMATNLQPADQRMRLNLARALAKSGDKAAARRELEQIVKSEQRSPVKDEAEQMLREL